MSLKKSEKRIQSGIKKPWKIVIDDGYVSYDFIPKMSGDFSISQVAAIFQLSIDLMSEDGSLRPKEIEAEPSSEAYDSAYSAPGSSADTSDELT